MNSSHRLARTMLPFDTEVFRVCRHWSSHWRYRLERSGHLTSLNLSQLPSTRGLILRTAPPPAHYGSIRGRLCVAPLPKIQIPISLEDFYDLLRG